MVYIYYIGKVHSSEHGRVTKYYRTVHYVTSSGATKSRDMICYKKTGELRAKSKMWTNYVNEETVTHKSHKAANREKALEEVKGDIYAKKQQRYWKKKSKNDN